MERWAPGYVLKRYQLALEWMRRSVSLLRGLVQRLAPSQSRRFSAKGGPRGTLKALPALRRRSYRRMAGSAPANPRLRTFGYRGEAQIKRPRPPYCADGAPFSEGSFASGGGFLVADASRGAGAVNGATRSKWARPGYDELAAAVHRLGGSRAVDEDDMSSEGPQQKRTAQAGCLRDVLRAVMLRGCLGRQCTIQAVASRVGLNLEAAGVPSHLVCSSAQQLANVSAFEVRSTTIRQ
jgi:hypothetical protein